MQEKTRLSARARMACVTTFAALSVGGAAAQTTANFDVKVTLTPACSIEAPASALEIGYTSFQTASIPPANTSFNVRCTKNYPFKVKLDETTFEDATTKLTVGLGLGVTSGVVTSVLGELSATGSGTSVPYYVIGTIATGQDLVAVATQTNQGTTIRRLTLTY